MHKNRVRAHISMKTLPMLRRILTAFAFAAVLALPPEPARAQAVTAPSAKDDQSTAEPSRPLRPRDPRGTRPSGQAKYELEIEGGVLLDANFPANDVHNESCLRNIIKLLREKHPDANIALSPVLADNVTVRDLKLVATDLGDELEALRVASGDIFIWQNKSAGHTPMLFTLEPSPEFLDEQNHSSSTQPQVEVFNFSSYFAQHLDSHPVNDDDLIKFKQNRIEMTKSIVLQTVNKLPFASKFATPILNFEFHQGANLLVVIGPEDAINIARKVINAMMEQPSGNSDSPGTERMFTVLGQVINPGMFDFPKNRSLNLLDAIAKAGGYTRIGAPNKVNVRRIENGTDRIFHLDAEKMSRDPNEKPFEILPGDNIIVTEKQF
jgi:hypothetical protein